MFIWAFLCVFLQIKQSFLHELVKFNKTNRYSYTLYIGTKNTVLKHAGDIMSLSLHPLNDGPQNNFSATAFVAILCAILALFILSACDSIKTESKAEFPTERGGQIVYTDKEESIFGEGGLDLFSTEKKETSSANALGVNKFLWQASLNTLSFMPIASADPFGGVIITDWYSPAGAENERFKTNVFLSGIDMKASGVKVSAFRQVKNGAEWVDASVSPETATKLEDAILAKARDIRIKSEL